VKRIGILGGVSAESTATYYLTITREYIRRFGDTGYPEILIYSVSFAEYAALQHAGRWEELAAKMAEAFRALAQAGAEFGLIAANTLHIVFDKVQALSPIPLLSIVEATARAVRKAGLSRVGLLGTRFTMEREFFRRGLSSFGIEVLVPPPEERELVHRVIYGELVRGEVRDGSRGELLQAIAGLSRRGAQGVILGCTELPLLIRPEDVELPLFDTARIHALAALEEALG
jgi:aspartate racemase